MGVTQQLPRSEVKFAPRRVGHGNFFVGELERSMGYYEQVLGLQVVFREPGINAGFLSNGNSHHDVGLIQVPTETLVGRDGNVQVTADPKRRPGLNHIGWEMETEAALVDAYRRAVAAGVDVHRTVDHQISHSVYLWDPEGYYHEFYADAEHDWREVYERNENALITGKWDPTASEPSQEPKYNASPTYQNVPGAPLRPIRAARVSLLVADLAAMTRFYTEVIGLDVAADRSADGFVILSGTVGYWDVGLFRSDAASRMHHLGFELADDAELGTATDRLRAAGADVVGEFEHATKSSVAVRDPDGIMLEFYVEHSRDPAQLATPLDQAPFTI
jgi:catechol 2,3-dioxygenase